LDLQTLSVDDICRIHDALAEEFANTGNPIFPPGVKSENLLASAVFRQHTGSDGRWKYPNPIDNAATLAYGICCDHPFHNGNKRTALVAMLVHLDKNKLTLFDVSQADLYKMILAVAEHTIAADRKRVRSTRSGRPNADDEVLAIAAWIKQRAKPITRGEKQITYRQLRHILQKFRYGLESPKNNAIEIVRYVEERRGFLRPSTYNVAKHIGSIPYPGDSQFVALKYLKYVRQVCSLREEDGVDSEAFYSEGDIVDAFINRYRTILRKLANK